jgi:excisionase family DNA binding protein
MIGESKEPVPPEASRITSLWNAMSEEDKVRVLTDMMSASGNVQPFSVSVPVATHLSGVGKTTVYKAIAEGDLKSFTLGRRRLILVSDLRDWLVSQATRSQI